MPSKAKSADDPSASAADVSGAEAPVVEANVPAFEPLESDESDADENGESDAAIAAAPAVVIATKRCYGRCDELGLHIPSGYIEIELLSDGSVRIV
jgi:hypothetical protein